jgi:thiamine-phosphate pyrophosphorylase
MFPEQPLVCIVTDRRRLVGEAASFEDGRDALVALAEAAASAAVSVIQIRERDLEAAPLAALTAAIVRATRGSATRVVVNDRLDVALASGADGVHLRGDSIAPHRARALAPAPFLIGSSVHSAAEARACAASADYLIAGTVFPTPSKPGAARLLSANGLREIVSAVDVPVLAIGGVTIDRIPEVAAAGAAGIAAIGLFASASRAVADVVQAVRTRFDTVRTAS